MISPLCFLQNLQSSATTKSQKMTSLTITQEQAKQKKMQDQIDSEAVYL